MSPIGNPPTTDIPATILMIPDILFLVFGHLARHDLARCLRVDHHFHDTAGQLLYGSKLGVEYGTTLSFSIYAPVQSSAEPIFDDHDHDRLSTFEESQYPYILPTVPCALSPIKTDLLGRVQHLTLHLKTNHHFQFYPPTPVDLFPSLHTLTLRYTRKADLFAYSASFFPHLRPRHIRLTRIPKLEIPYYIYLDKGLGSRVERVTLHVNQPLSDETWSEARPRLLPASMCQLDLVFRHIEERPTSVVRSVISVSAGSIGRTDRDWDVLEKELEPSLQNEWLIGPSFRARALRDRDLCRDSTALINIAKVAASAFATGARVRVVGVEDENQVRDNMGTEVRPDDDEVGKPAGVRPQADILGNLREAYVSALKEAGLAAEDARRRADDMELISLDEYWREPGNVAF